MRTTVILVIFFLSASTVYAQTDNNASNVTINAATTNQTVYMPFEEDYTKPRLQDNKNQTASETIKESKEDMPPLAKVLISK